MGNRANRLTVIDDGEESVEPSSHERLAESWGLTGEARANELERRYEHGLLLTEVNRTLVGVFDFDQVTAIVCRAVRELTGADGATFVLREGPRVRYAAEDSIAPLWKGLDFPIESCISGWSMLNVEPAVIPDIYADERIPHAAYRSTFVQSLVMTPVGPGTPVASIGAYWAQRHEASRHDVELLRSLASAADLALGGVRSYHEARRAWAEAEQANRLKDEFLATLSHELRNPLNSIVGFSELLLRQPETKQLPVVRQAAASIHSNAQLQARLINDLLDLSRLQTGKLNIERHPVDLVSLVSEAVESARDQASAKQVELELEVDPAVGERPLTVNADDVRVRQIIWNLVNNAIKFTPRRGHVGVRLSADGRRALFVVEDTGQGIDAQFLPHVFEMFRQGDGRTTRVHGGLGIGLALVRQLAELHDGRVEAYSGGVGLGARFSVELPLHAVSTEPRPEASGPMQGSLSGARVLVVDDTEDSVEMLRLLLSSEGARVATALNGADALEVAAQEEFDLIVSDISMPVMDGYELIRRLRANERYARTPAIALSGFGREGDIERARQAGFTTQLTKPLEFASFLKLARVTLQK